MSEKKQSIRDIEEFSIKIGQCYKDVECALDSLKESLDKLNSRLDKYFGKE